MRRVSSILILLLLAFPLRAEMPPIEDLAAQRLFVGVGGYWPADPARMWRADGGAGIWHWDIESGDSRRIRPLATALMYGRYLDAAVTGLEDRYVVHHQTMLEFDAVTNRFLRSYRAWDEPYRPLVFFGFSVDETTAPRLGIPAGYYGGLRCPGYDFIICPTNVAPPPLPGRSSLLHRPLDPEVTQLSRVPISSLPEGLVSWTIDTRRARIWILTENRLGYMPLVGGDSPDLVVVESQTDPPLWSQHGIVYDPPSDSIFLRSPDGSLKRQRRADLSAGWRTFTPGVPFNFPRLYQTSSLSGGLPATYEQVVPVVGSGPGAAGTYWRSDVWFFNPSNEPVKFSTRRVSARGEHEFELPSHGSMELTDALARLGGGPVTGGGDGVTNDALVITSPYRWGEQLTVYSRTYTANGSGSGTYGQAVPAVPSRYGYANNGTFVLDRRNAGQFRHNVGIVNDDDRPLTVKFDGQRSEEISVPPRTVANINVDEISPADTHRFGAVPLEVETSRPVPVWLSMIDNKTGDGTFVPFSNFALEGALDATTAIPQIASTEGAYATRWRSDLYGVFETFPLIRFTERSGFLRTSFYPRDRARCSENKPMFFEEIESTRWLFPDVASKMTQCATENLTGALELNAGSWTTGYTRTYTTREDGGTLGDVLPMYPIGGWPVQHFSGIGVRAGFRINLGLYNGLDYDVAHRLLVYDSNGTEVARRDLILTPRQSMQAPLSEFVGPLQAGLYGLTVLPLDAPNRPGRSWAWVSIIDNATGDPTNLW